MEAQSPPKRVTRARAAAKSACTVESAASKSTVTASTRASAARRTAASMKRKTRADDDELDEELHQASADDTITATSATTTKTSKARGRSKKTQPEDTEGTEPADTSMTVTAKAPAATTKTTRGRPKKIVAENTKPDPVKIKATRTRAATSKIDMDMDMDEDELDTQTEPARKTTTTRRRAASTTAKSGTVCIEPITVPTPGLKSAVSRPASRMAVPTKKSVTFEEPAKEDPVRPVASRTKAKAKVKAEESSSATGMRAKPVRKPAASMRTTRAASRTNDTGNDDKSKPTPLSPKKDGHHNRSLSREEESDDELAMPDKASYKPMMKSPVKPPSALRKLQLNQELADENAVESILPPGLASPARRPASSPLKDSVRSPAKRVDAIPVFGLSDAKSAEGTQSLFKNSLLQSPAKRPPVPIKSLQGSIDDHFDQPTSPMKGSFLHTPARRPASPVKFHASPSRSSTRSTVQKDATEKGVIDHQAPAEGEIVVAGRQDDELLAADGGDAILPDADVAEDDEAVLDSPCRLEFPGRLSAVLPRHADPALRASLSPSKSSPSKIVIEMKAEIAPEPEAAVIEPEVSREPVDDPMHVDGCEEEQIDCNSLVATPEPAVRFHTSMFGLRQKDLVPAAQHDESEDELASNTNTLTRFHDDSTLTSSVVPATPTPGLRNGLPSSARKAADRAIRSVSGATKLGYTPLAMKFSEWRAGSPLKTGATGLVTADEELSLLEMDIVASSDSTKQKATFFEDEMMARTEMESSEAAMIAAMEADIAAGYADDDEDDVTFTNEVALTKEDVELAAEANEMSLLEVELVEAAAGAHPHDDANSEASQEYGDENAIPIDPALLGARPVTPMRQGAVRTFNTTTKVPLKPADDSPPRSIKRRSASVSKLPTSRPTGGLTRNATVISYSPSKKRYASINETEDDEGEDESAPATPSKSETWSSAGTPARTPRRDVDPALLRGAVVFVDVHTSEGADASTVFVELLTQMGARCVKSWPWNPTGPSNGEASASKIGITHVVFKDGGKRTMEKVRESRGVVQCVGVGWVLDCEREGAWMDEAPYYIDTSIVPRGGGRRRKSMEPKAIANLNGTLVTPVKQTGASARECHTVPNNHIGRRDSTVWMRTPPDNDEEMMDVEDSDDRESTWGDMAMLTPVPKTPAPEAIARYALDLTPETPTVSLTGAFSPGKEQLLMQTAPPKQQHSIFADLGQGIIGQEKDQGVMMRLMAARRKSLQFAPKVASPLSKAWN